MGETFEECFDTVQNTVKLLHELGFVIHPDKSVFMPSQNIVFLGFIIDSKSMTVKLTEQKALNLKQACNEILKI